MLKLTETRDIQEKPGEGTIEETIEETIKTDVLRNKNNMKGIINM